MEAPLGGGAPFQDGKANGAGKGVDAALDRPLPAVRARRWGAPPIPWLPRCHARRRVTPVWACVCVCVRVAVDEGVHHGRVRLVRLYSTVVGLNAAAAASSEALLLCRGWRGAPRRTRRAGSSCVALVGGGLDKPLAGVVRPRSTRALGGGRRGLRAVGPHVMRHSAT